jgi:ribonucleoside-triphosphate reductase
MWGDKICIIRPDGLPFEGGYYYPQNLFAFTPQGPRRIEKVSRRRAEEGELIRIKTSSGKSLKVTREHRIPIKADRMVIRKA